MIEKITLEQFHEIKRQLIDIIDVLNDTDDYILSNEVEQKYFNEYMELQEKLLSYDLSNIPKEEWEGMMLISTLEHPLNLSNTHAKIDFELLEISLEDDLKNVSFKSCNITNLDALARIYSIYPENFDKNVIDENNDLFISNNFSEEFQRKFYDRKLFNGDLFSLNDTQIEELKQKELLLSHFDIENNDLFLETCGIEKIRELYNYSKEIYDVVDKILNKYFVSSSLPYVQGYEEKNKDFINKMSKASISEMKDICYEYARSKIIDDGYINSNLYDNYPVLFVKENSDLFLTDENIPNDLRERYYNGKLTINDLFNNIDVFDKIPIDNFLIYDMHLRDITRRFGFGNLQKLIKNHSDFARYLFNGTQIYNFFIAYDKIINDDEEFEINIRNAAKIYFADNIPNNFRDIDDNNNITYNIPNWLSSFNFNVIEKITNVDGLMNCDDNTLILSSEQNIAIISLGKDNLKKLEDELHIFSHQFDNGQNSMYMFEALSAFICYRSPKRLKELNINLQNGKLSYEDFKNEFAKVLNSMRANNIFLDFPNNYDWIQGKFRYEHPEIFMPNDAPQELKDAFYKNRITFDFIYKNKQYLPYFLDKNLKDILKDYQMKFVFWIPGEKETNRIDFLDEYIRKYGNEKFLNLIVKYGAIISNISVFCENGEIEFDDEQLVEKRIRDSIYNKILNGANYRDLIGVKEFVDEHPDLFLSLRGITTISDEEKREILNNFFDGYLNYDDIKKYPELIPLLRDKNLNVAFRHIDINRVGGYVVHIGDERKIPNNNLLNIFDNETFLQLCSKYGNYLKGVQNSINNYPIFEKQLSLNTTSIEEKIAIIEEIITRECHLGNMQYSPEDAPSFLKEKHPELFLSDDAPEELKKYFYRSNSNFQLNFSILNKHKEWLPFLEGKSLSTALLKSGFLKQDLMRFFSLFGEEKAIKLGINRSETVYEMLRSHKVLLMKEWYDKTGGKFIPDYVVMQLFPIEEADKFLLAGSYWSNLMRIQSFARTSEGRDAMLKLAYSFGVFDQDQRGLKKLQNLLTNLPKKIDAYNGYIIEQIDYQIDLYSQRGYFYHNRDIIDDNGNYITELPKMTLEEKEEAYNKMIEYAKNKIFVDLLDTKILVNLLETLKNEKVNIDFAMPIFAQLYRKNEDETYSLTINSQSYPKTAQIIRNILEKFKQLPIVSPDIAHHYFGGFKLEYDPDFREFFLSNYNIIMNNSKYLSQISTIQRRFKEIKTIYSNVTLTLDLVISFISNNKYENVNIGNERVAKITALQNYSQQEFDILQQIYNYGKQRVFSSIPRIASDDKVSLPSGTYYYEILRLDDPRAMSIGFESNCCQRLGEYAEVCMEHSMVDKNGRVMVITNEIGEVVAQSWIWRNKDVLCFDNIEIPDQKMWDSGVPRGKEDSGIRNQFTDDILTIYQMAARELIKADEEVYRELYESGKITKEQYEELRLGKITTGLGFSNIKGSLKTLPIDRGILARPLPFDEPVKLKHPMDLDDSTIQYILEQREDRKEYDGETLSVHSDTYIEYTDNNFTKEHLFSLERLELVTKNDPNNLETTISDYADENHLVTELAHNYDLYPENTRIIMNPNFAIIYEENDNQIVIGDLFFNLRVNLNGEETDISNIVIMQIRLALDQISKDKNIDISSLSDEQKKIYNKAISLKNEIDIERGVGNAK